MNNFDHYIRKSTWFAALLAIALVTGCSGGKWDSSPAPAAAPAVTDTTPDHEAVNVAVTTSVNVTFDAAMDAATINDTTFTLTGPADAAVAGAVTYSAANMTATFMPTNDLEYDTSYTATITTDALSATVARLAEDAYLWPMFVWTATDAATRSGRHVVAATIAHDTADRAYRYWDSREFSEEGRLPGVTCEYWGLDGRCGAEGYGWGAFGVHLVLGTLHTTGAVKTIDRIIDALPGELREQTKSFLAQSLKAVVTQVLVKTPDGRGRKAVLEILVNNRAIAKLIMSDQSHQIPAQLQTGRDIGMQLMDQALLAAIEAGEVDPDDAFRYTQDKRKFKRFVTDTGILPTLETEE